jgi:hypothetical protein
MLLQGVTAKLLQDLFERPLTFTSGSYRGGQFIVWEYDKVNAVYSGKCSIERCRPLLPIEQQPKPLI